MKAVKNKELKLVKVIFEYANGTKKSLKGRNLAKWEKAMEASALMSWIHGGKTGFESIKWTRL